MFLTLFTKGGFAGTSRDSRVASPAVCLGFPSKFELGGGEKGQGTRMVGNGMRFVYVVCMYV